MITILAIVITFPNYKWIAHEPLLLLQIYKLCAPILAYGLPWGVWFAFCCLVAILVGTGAATALLCVAGALGNLYLLIDSYVFALYRFHLDGTILFDLLQPDIRKDAYFSTSFMIKIGLLCLALAAVHVVVYKLALRYGRVLGGRRSLFLMAAWALPAVWAQAAYAYAFANYDARYQAVTEALPFYRPSPMMELTDRLGLHPKKREQAISLHSPANGRFSYPRSQLVCGKPETKVGRPLSVLFVVVDALRFDTSDPETMPRVNHMADRHGAFRFNDHVSGGSSTRPGMFSIFYGLPEFYFNAALADRRPPVTMDHFERHGYRFGIFVSSSLIRPPLDRSVFARLSNLKLQANGDLPWQRDIASTDDFVSFVDAPANTPFFSFLFYDAVHASNIQPGTDIRFTPFLEAVDYSALGPDYDPAPYLNRYRQTVHQVDAQIGRLFDALERNDRLKDTVVIVTSDHGQEYNDNKQNYWGHGSNLSKVQLHVPMFVWWPGKQGAEIQERTAHYDIVPTLMRDLFNCTTPPADFSFGENLFDRPATERTIPVASKGNYGLVQGNTVTLFRRYGPPEVLDIRTNTVIQGKPPAPHLSVLLQELRGRFVQPSERSAGSVPVPGKE